MDVWVWSSGGEIHRGNINMGIVSICRRYFQLWDPVKSFSKQRSCRHPCKTESRSELLYTYPLTPRNCNKHEVSFSKHLTLNWNDRNRNNFFHILPPEMILCNNPHYKYFILTTSKVCPYPEVILLWGNLGNCSVYAPYLSS